MARTELTDTVLTLVGGVLTAVTGASVQVNVRLTGAAATVYAAETGATTVSNPVTTTTGGVIAGWVEEGSYDQVISGSGFTTYTQRFESNSGRNTLTVYNAKTYGNLTGLGLVDESVAIEAFYNAVPAGSWVFFPQGIYMGLHDPDKQIGILGSGKHTTEFRPPAAPAASSKLVDFGSSTKCSLIGVKLNAQGVSGIIRGVNSEGNGTDKHLLIANNWFENFTSTTSISPHGNGAAAIYVWTSDAVRVSGNDFVDCIYGAYMDTPSIDCTVVENKVWCTGTSASGTATTTTASANLTVVTPTTAWVNGMVISGNGIPAATTILSGAGTATMVMSAVITGSGAAGVKITASNCVTKGGITLRRTSTAAAGSLVALNSVENVRSDQGGIGVEGHGIDLVKVQGVRCIGNSVRDCATAGVHVGGGSYGAMVLANNLSECTIINGGAIYVELNIGQTNPTQLNTGSGRRNGCTVIGNTIFGNLGYGMSLSYAAGSMVTANTVYENGYEGIFVDSDYVSINGNQVYNNYNTNNTAAPTSTPNVQAQIRVTTGSNCIISDNTVTDNQVTPTADYGIAIGNGNHTVNSNQIGTHVVGDIYVVGNTNDVQGYGTKLKESGIFGTSGLKMGRATLVAGTVTVSTAAITANSEVFFDVQTAGGTQGFLRKGTVVAGTSFQIVSTSATETSVVAWQIVEPA